MLHIPDVHEPWSHPKAIDHCRRTQDKYKCDKVVLAGDEIDAAAFSKYPMNPNLPSAADELNQAIERLQKWYKAFPEAKVCSSNHGTRIFKKTTVSGIPYMVIRRYEEILKYPEGWSIHDQIEIDGVLYIHGDSFNRTSWRGAHEKLKQSVVMGHQHSCAGVVYSQGRKRRLFSANMGCLIDVRRAAFDYAKNSIEKPCLGAGVIIDGEQAFFVPLG